MMAEAGSASKASDTVDPGHLEVRRMPRIIVEWFEGRTLDQKRRLAKLITDAVLEVDQSLKNDAVEVVYRDISRADFARGGVLRIDK